MALGVFAVRLAQRFTGFFPYAYYDALIRPHLAIKVKGIQIKVTCGIKISSRKFRIIAKRLSE